MGLKVEDEIGMAAFIGLRTQAHGPMCVVCETPDILGDTRELEFKVSLNL